MGLAAREAMEERSFEVQYLKAWELYARAGEEKPPHAA
jgi:hypothetical protein